MENRKCSYCGNEDVSIEERIIIMSEPFGGTDTVKIKEIVCKACSFTEDDDDNDVIVLKALASLKRSSMVNILTSLNSEGYTNASMERALELPSRTLARWKNEHSISASSAGIALMRIIRSFPWILEVAENHFDQEKAQHIFLTHAMNEIAKKKS